jgi:hypothetical protein
MLVFLTIMVLIGQQKNREVIILVKLTGTNYLVELPIRGAELGMMENWQMGFSRLKFKETGLIW